MSEAMIWNKYRQIKKESEVIRSGFGIYGVYPYNPNNKFDINRSESDLEHTAGVITLLTLIVAFHPDLIDRNGLNALLIGALFHEVGELYSGDIPDDGRRDDQMKDENEWSYLEEYLNDMPYWFKNEAMTIFNRFQRRSTPLGRILFCADKLEAVLQGLIYESEGRGGHWAKKQAYNYPLSNQDEEGLKTTGSDNLVDIWAYHYLQITAPFDTTGLFKSILKAAVKDIRGSWFSWDK